MPSKYKKRNVLDIGYGELCEYKPQRVIRNGESYKGRPIGHCKLICVCRAGKHTVTASIATLWYSNGTQSHMGGNCVRENVGPYLMLVEDSDGDGMDRIGAVFTYTRLKDIGVRGFPSASVFTANDDYVRIFGLEALRLLEPNKTIGIRRRDLTLDPGNMRVLNWHSP